MARPNDFKQNRSAVLENISLSAYKSQAQTIFMFVNHVLLNLLSHVQLRITVSLETDFSSLGLMLNMKAAWQQLSKLAL